MENMKYIHTKYCPKISDLSDFLRTLYPQQIVAITERVGYTVVWKSNKEYSWQ